jgi:hypothetical protein
MLLEAVDVHVAIWLSLTIIISVLAATVVLSLKIPPKEHIELNDPDAPHWGDEET